MPVPKRRHTHSRKSKRRSHDALKSPTFVTCPRCGRQIKAHTVCPTCEYYKGREYRIVRKEDEK